MNGAQAKRLYRLLACAGAVVFLILGFRTVHELWDDHLGDSLTERFRSRLRDHEILADREYDRILAEQGELAAEEFRQSPHPDSRLHRAWVLKDTYERWSWVLTLGSMVLVSVLVYRVVWLLADRSFRYVRDGSVGRPKLTENRKPNKARLDNPLPRRESEIEP